jgi:hypothetical protein
MSVPWKHASLAACLRQINLSLFLWSTARRGHGTRVSTGAHLSKEARSEAMGHVVAPEPTSARRCGLKLQLMW